jgi:VIT1/CCC1 family predicted Fe2+/Mn2+ transporter
MSEHAHTEKHFTSSNTVRDIILGMSDGLTVPFALAAGLSSAGSGVHIIVVAGLAEMVAGAVSMGLGGYLAAKSELEHYDKELAREHHEIETLKEKEQHETIEIFKAYGLSAEHLAPVLHFFENNPNEWAAFMMRYELGLERPDESRARRSALTIGTAYVVGGIIPLSPYFFVHSAEVGLVSSVIVTILALLIFGYVKSKVVGTQPFHGMVRTALIGGTAAAAAFFLAKFFE